MELIKDTIDFRAYEGEPEARQKVREASAYAGDLIADLAAPEAARGLFLPWPKTREQFRVRPNELTLWPGVNGHGKSLVLNQVMVGLMAQGERVLIASMEMKPRATLGRMVRQAIGTATPTAADVSAFMGWSSGKMYVYDHVGAVQWKRLIAALRFAADVLGITQFVVDSLMRCGIGEQDYDGQKAFIDALCTFRMDYPAHVHLVMHARKREDENSPPGKFDAKGSGTMTDLADNVVTTWRNKRKEAAYASNSRKSADILEQPDALLIVDKQRHGDWEGKIGLWFLNGSGQFVESGMTTSPTPMIGVAR